MCATPETFGDETIEPKLDYQLATIPGSRLQVRGPLPDFDSPFVAVLGGNEVFGKYVALPFPELLADHIGFPVANLGVAHAGLSLFSEEQGLLDLASRAEVTVLQVLGAQNMSNRLYSVHSRRNDRFLGVSPALRELFPDVDFAEINFTGHLISTLRAASPDAFQVLVDELKWAWVQRMHRVLSLIRGKVILLWVSDHRPGFMTPHVYDFEPHFVDARMLREIDGAYDGMVEVMVEPKASLDGKVFLPHEATAARSLPAQSDHVRIANSLTQAFSEMDVFPGNMHSAAGEKDQSFSISSGTAVNRSATRP